jgi:hypothetical protein
MYLTRIGTSPRRRAPIPEGPTMEVLFSKAISSTDLLQAPSHTSPPVNGSA